MMGAGVAFFLDFPLADDIIFIGNRLDPCFLWCKEGKKGWQEPYRRDKPQPKGLDYFWFALYAFLGLGGEVLLAYGVEPFLYGTDMANWSRGQNILHWILTCLIWGAGHFFTKEMLTGLLCMVDGFMFGVVYLLTNRDIKKAFILLFLLFVF